VVTVNVTPDNSGSIKINGTTYNSFPAQRSVPDNSTILLEAIPADGYTFVQWSGPLSGNQNPTTYLVTCDTSIFAIFQEAANKPPVADAGDDQTVDERSTVTLNGSASVDPDGEIATYHWIQTEGTTVVLHNSNTVSPTFTAPPFYAGEDSFIFQLTVTDSEGLDDSDTCMVTIRNIEDPPVADAGADQNVVEGSTVTLTGSASYDPDGNIETYRWTQTEGTPVTLSDSTAVNPTFTAPDTGAGGETLTFELTVTDGGELENSDSCAVTVRDTLEPPPTPPVNEPPVADAGADQTVVEGSTVTLDGSASFDSDGTIASYQWTQTAGTYVPLSDSTAVSPTFVTPPVDAGGTELSFDLKITDNEGEESLDQVSVTVSDNTISGFPADVITFSSATGKDMGIKAGTGCHITSLQALSSDTIGDSEDKPDNLTYGLIEMEITVDTPGDTVEVTIYLAEAAPEDYTCFKYLTGSGWVDFSANAIFNQDRDQVTLTLTDGGDGDDDGSVNGVIIDPLGFGTDPDSSSTPSDGGSGGGDDGGGCFISTVRP